MTNIFNIDYDVLVQLLVRAKLRGANVLLVLKSLAAPVKRLYDQFSAFRTVNLYYLEHNSQVCKMEAVLNDRFDQALRRITILDGEDLEPLYVFQEPELHPLYAFQESENQALYLYQQSQTDIGVDFIVKVPATVSFDVIELKALVNYYRLPSKHNYIIELI